MIRQFWGAGLLLVLLNGVTLDGRRNSYLHNESATLALK